MRILRLNLKREYWEAIRDGNKPYEYRRTTNPYWDAFLEGFIPTKKNWKSTVLGLALGAAFALYMWGW